MVSSLRSAMVQNRQQLKEDTWQWLESLAGDNPLALLVGRMLASLVCGEGAMPRQLGMDEVTFNRMLSSLFPGVINGAFASWGSYADDRRDDEREELRVLFLAHARDEREQTRWVATLLTEGCMGGDHLWQDLGLWSRNDLSELIALAFPALAEKNVKDMKWKRFFYKQLCEQEGVYTCRSPSCEVCPDYQACFGPEE